MKKITINSLNSAITFVLFGLTFAFPFKEFVWINEGQIEFTFSIYPILLVFFLGIILVTYISLKVFKKMPLEAYSEQYYADEREKDIVAAANKNAYLTLMSGLIIGIAVLGVFEMIQFVEPMPLNMYQIAVLAMALLLVLSTMTYYITWIYYYKK